MASVGKTKGILLRIRIEMDEEEYWMRCEWMRQ